MSHTLLRTPIVMLGLLAFTGCDDADSDGRACFPLPGGDVLRVGESHNGTSLQGGAPEIPTQGPSLQGGRSPGIPTQGTRLQGAAHPQPYIPTQGRYLGIGDLDGVRILVPDTRASVTMDEGRLVGTASTLEPDATAELLAVTRDGRELAMQVTALAGDRFAVVVEGEAVCATGQEGVFVPGAWDDTGAHTTTGDELTYACMDGVIAKCVGWGYAPWSAGADVHQSCTRLARADYCGDGRPWTLDGTAVDIYDALGVRTRIGDAELAFEAGWNEDGAVCATATRYAIEDDGAIVRPDCFAGLPECTSLATATELGATIVNESAHEAIAACD